MIYTKDFGFKASNSPEENSIALQKAIDMGGDIYVDEPGVYDVSETVTIGDDTSIYFANGVYLKRNFSKDETGFVFINKGAYKREFNKNIKLVGLKLICSGVVSDQPCETSKRVITGLRGHVSFFYIKNLEIRDIEILDLPAKDYGIHICTFNNVLIENVRIEGRKDAVHFGTGEKFVVRHGIFKTFDDPIALNAHDYTTGNPELGWIENGIIEDCYDMDDSETTGYFCRVLAGAWRDWFLGIEVQNSDTVAFGGRLYRVLGNVSGEIYKSVTPPNHTFGIMEFDGIKWVMVQDRVVYGSGCKNIHFKNIYLQKKRPIAFSLHFDKDNYSRSYYPNATPPVQENIIFENIYVQNEIPEFLSAVTPVDNIRIVNSSLKGNTIHLKDIETEGIDYKKTKILISGTTFSENKFTLLKTDGKRTADIKLVGNLTDDEFDPIID